MRGVGFSLSQEHSAPPRRPYLGKDPRNGAFDLGVLTSCSASHEVGDEPRWGKDCIDHHLRWLSSYLEPEEPAAALGVGLGKRSPSTVLHTEVPGAARCGQPTSQPTPPLRAQGPHRPLDSVSQEPTGSQDPVGPPRLQSNWGRSLPPEGAPRAPGRQTSSHPPMSVPRPLLPAPVPPPHPSPTRVQSPGTRCQ